MAITISTDRKMPEAGSRFGAGRPTINSQSLLNIMLGMSVGESFFNAHNGGDYSKKSIFAVAHNANKRMRVRKIKVRQMSEGGIVGYGVFCVASDVEQPASKLTRVI